MASLICRTLTPSPLPRLWARSSVSPASSSHAADTEAAQTFTTVHELAYIAAGESALSDAGVDRPDHDEHERWCNRVAAEFLVPRAILPAASRGVADTAELQRSAASYRVSTLVVFRRLHDTQLIGWDEYRARYREELSRVREFARKAFERSRPPAARPSCVLSPSRHARLERGAAPPGAALAAMSRCLAAPVRA